MSALLCVLYHGDLLIVYTRRLRALNACTTASPTLYIEDVINTHAGNPRGRKMLGYLPTAFLHYNRFFYLELHNQDRDPKGRRRGLKAPTAGVGLGSGGSSAVSSPQRGLGRPQPKLNLVHLVNLLRNFGHVVRADNLCISILHGRIAGTRKRGRRRWTDDIKDWDRTTSG